MLVAGAVEIDGGKPRRARLKVIEGFGKQELQAFVLGAVAPQTQLVTDDWPFYHNLPDVRHNAITLGPMAAHIALPWDPSAVFKPQALGSGRLSRTAEKQTSSITSTSSCSASIGAEHAMWLIRTALPVMMRRALETSARVWGTGSSSTGSGSTRSRR